MRSRETATLLFGVFFGLLEAVVVVYIQKILGTGNGLINRSISPSDVQLSLGFIAFLTPRASTFVIADAAILALERWREAATIVMLAAFGYAAGTGTRQRLACFFLSFAVWDIFYYVFLRIFTGWPQTLTSTDVFFLIPTAWVGPVSTPLAISSLLAIASLRTLMKSS